MRKLTLLFFLALACPLAALHAQDFSNKGRDFWLSYSHHVGGAGLSMTLYITSDVATTFSVEVGATTIQNGSLNAGQVISVVIPNTAFVQTEGQFYNRGIHVTAAKPVVVYSYITRSQASGATLCLPVNVLGKEYYAMSFTQVSNESPAYSFVTVVAVEDNTTVEITPSGNTQGGWIGGTTYSVNLNKGEIYQILGQGNGTTGVDLSGSHIRSVAGAGGTCKKIAVFSGSGKIRLPATCANNSSDNLYQQLYPVASWGKRFLTVPSYNHPNNYYRVAKSVPTANVYVNGALIPPASFVNNIYYEFINGTQNLIESDQPISVTQYFTTQGCNGNPAPYDPDMIVLNPVEQNIDKVTLVSSNLLAGQATYRHQHHIHVIMNNGGTGISSFKLDNVPVAPSRWVTHPGDPNYSYLYLDNVGQGYHTLASDSGFNAIAYGFGDAESYGYSAGANVKDLYQYVSVENEFASVDFPAACKGAPFELSMTFPYQPTSITWRFNGLFADVTETAPVYTSTTVVNGRTLYKYKLPSNYTVPAAGIYPIKVLAENPTADGCSGNQEIDYDLQVFDLPTADFNFSTNGCLTSPVSFTGNPGTLSGRPITHQHWSFGDSNIKDDETTTTHTYTTAGSYEVKYTLITDVGCKADTVRKTVVVTDPPVASFTSAGPYCATKAVTFTDNSTIATGTIDKWAWNFGDGSPVVTNNTNAPVNHIYATTGTFTVSLTVTTAGGCASLPFTQQVTIHPNPVADFALPNVCLPAGNASFNATATIPDGTGPQLTYAWDFGDGSAAGAGNPGTHTYSATGPYNVVLTVTSNNGCATPVTKNITTIFAEPRASFTTAPEVCLGNTITLTDASTAPGSSVTEWQWDFNGDGVTDDVRNSGAPFTHTFATAGPYNIILKVKSAAGCESVTPANIATHTVVVNPLPVAAFAPVLPGCKDQAASFTDNSVANAGSIVKWTWNFGDGSGPKTLAPAGGTVSNTYTTPGTYTVTLQVETDKGCVSTTTSGSVVIHGLPVAAFTAPDACTNDVAAPFTDASQYAGGSITAWQWNFGDPNANAGNPNTSTQQNPTHHYTQAGTYTATLIATTNEGCTAQTTRSVVVNSSNVVADFTVQNTGPLCSNKDIVIKDASTIDQGKIIRLEIYWDYTGDPTNKTTDNSPANGREYTHTYPQFGSPATRTYRVRYEAYSGITCVNVLERDITLGATPQLNFDPLTALCSNEPSFVLTQAQILNGGVLSGTAAYSGPGVGTGGNFDPNAAGAGTHTITYTYDATNGCSNSVQQTIVINPTPVANAGADKVVLEGGQVTLTPTIISNIPVSYSWTPVTYLSNPSIASAIVVKPEDDITYTLEVVSDKGCHTSDAVFVKLLKTPVIPNIFSPNGDGINDRWVIPYLESYPGCVVQIYNRYGQLIHQIVNYTTPWDGRINGKDAPVGTYYYIIDPKNGRKPMTGFVDIIR